MWRRPEPSTRDQPPANLAPSGVRLCALARPNRDRADEELRVTLDSFEGHPYISVRLFYADDAGEFRPSKKGVSVRMGEARQVADALMQALAIVEGGKPKSPARSRGNRPDPKQWRDGHALPGIDGKPQNDGDSFDEFGPGE